MEQQAYIPARLWVQFNLLPATYAHFSWYDATESLQARLTQLGSAPAQRILSRWLLERYGLQTCSGLRCAADGLQSWDEALCLREPRWLQRLALVLGMLQARTALRHRVADDTLRRLAQELGAGTVREALAVWPEPAFMMQQTQHAVEEPLVPGLLKCGAQWLFGWLEPLDSAITGRTRLKFARPVAERPPAAVDVAARAAAREYLQSFIIPAMASCH
jgi:YOP proteins translocation protein K (YscK)/Bacterial type III secretion apparatus protein (OrgA_MxiK)